MVLKIKIDVSADASKLQPSVSNLEKYVNNVRATSESLKKFQSELRSVQKTAKQTLKIFEEQSATIDHASNTHRGFSDAVRTAGSLFSRLARDTRGVAENLARAASSLLSITTLTGAVGGLIGFAGGLFGAQELSRSVMVQRRAAMGLGIGYGQLNSLSTNFARLGDVQSQLGSVAGGLYNYSSPLYTTLLATGATGLGNSQGTTQTYVDLMRRIPELFKDVPEGAIGLKSQALGLDQYMSVLDIVKRLHTSASEFDQLQRNSSLDVAAMNLSPEVLKAWTDLSVTLEASGNIIQSVLAETLVPLTGPTGDLSKGMIKVIDAFAASQLALDAINGVEGGIKFISDKLGDKTLQDDAARFMRGLIELESRLKTVLRYSVPVVRGAWEVLKAVTGQTIHVQGSFGALVHKYNPWTYIGPDDPSTVPDAPIIDDTKGPAYKFEQTRSVPSLIPMTSPGTTSAPASDSSGLSSDFSGLRLSSNEAVAGGAVEAGLIALARHEQSTENVSAFHAFKDSYHTWANPNSFHNRGLAFDVSLNGGDYDGARSRVRAYLTGLGLKEGGMGGLGDFAIESGTYDHLHVQFNSKASAQKYLEDIAPKSQKSRAELIQHFRHGRQSIKMPTITGGFKTDVPFFARNPTGKYSGWDIETKKKDNTQSYLDQFRGAKDNRSVIVQNLTGEATVDTSRQVYG